MHERIEPFAGGFVSADRALEHEFELRLLDSSTLAFRVAYSVLRQREDAEDVAQEAFARAYRRFAALRDRERFRAWLVRITWRLALDRQRADRRRSKHEVPLDVELRPATAADTTDARERAAQLWRAIDELPGKLRLAIVLGAIEGHDVREVAKLLNVPEGTVKSRLFHARKQLKERLSWMATNAHR
jgi:RNA polymerase sigma-70 factor (ECF subfamily)